MPNDPQFDDAKLNGIRKRLIEYKESNGDSWAILGQKTGLGGSTLQAFAYDKYKGNNAGVAAEVEKWFKTSETLQMFPVEDYIVPYFQPTPTAAKIRNTLIWTQRGKMSAIMGHPGLGKTQTLERFKLETHNVVLVTASPTCSTVNAILEAVLEAFEMPPGKRSANQLSGMVRRAFKARDNALLIVDEAQHLGERALEELRAIHDSTKIGLALCGNMEVTRNVEGNRTANFAQRFSRLSMRLMITQPDPKDVTMLLDAWVLDDGHARKLLTEIAMRPGGGALRSMSQTLELATLLARADQPEAGVHAPVSYQHVRDAWAQLSAGVAA